VVVGAAHQPAEGLLQPQARDHVVGRTEKWRRH
jgi:hypothetical protein